MAELVKFGRGSQETYESNWEETMQDFVYFAEDTQTIFMNGKEYSAYCEACLEWEDTGDYNYIVMLDGTIHEIDDIDEFCLSGNEEETQTFTSEGSSLTVTKEDIKEVHASLPVSSTNYWCNELFYSWTNLTTADIVFKYSNETSAGNYFGFYMFYNCSSLTTINKDFTLPQSFTTVGNYFCSNMFWKCSSLAELPKNFNLPQKLITVGSGFTCNNVYNIDTGFLRDTLITKLPSKFNIPQDIESVGDQFCGSLISGCVYLEELPDGFNLPQKLTTVPNSFCGGMTASALIGFARGCTSLKKLPKGFNLPPNLTSVGGQFCNSMFDNCTSLEELPEGFNFPQGVTVVADRVFNNMFANCTSLKRLPDGFNLPPAITEAGEYFCSSMFSGCSALEVLPNDFNLPQNMESAGDSYCSSMFSSCSSLQPGTDVAVTFVFDASSCMSGTQFTPTSAEAGQTYYIKGNYESVKTSFNIDISLGDIFTDDSGSVTFTGFTTSDGVTYQFDESLTLHNGESGSVSFQASGEVSSITGGIVGEYTGTIDGDTLGIWINDSNSTGESTVEETFNGSVTGSFSNSSNTYDVNFVNTIIVNFDIDQIYSTDDTNYTELGVSRFFISATKKGYLYSSHKYFMNHTISTYIYYIPGKSVDSILGYLSSSSSIDSGGGYTPGLETHNNNNNDLYFNGELIMSKCPSREVPYNCNLELNYSTTQVNTWEVTSTVPDPSGFVNTTNIQYPIDSSQEFSFSGNGKNGSSLYSEDTLTFISNGLYISVNREDIISVDCSLAFVYSSTTSNYVGWGNKLFKNLVNCETININNIGENINNSNNNNICNEMFYNCSKLKSITGTLKLPSSITNPGDDFCNSMFYNCTSLESIPNDISFPENLESVGENFGKDMFYNCSSLQPGEVALTFPFEAEDAFVNTQFTPTTAAAGSTYYLKGNNEDTPTYDNYIVTTDGDIYPIDSPYNFEADNTSSSSSVNPFQFNSNGELVSIERKEVSGVHIDIPLDRANEDYFCGNLFRSCPSLRDPEITFSGECSSVGNYCFRYMFFGCEFEAIAEGFTLPQSITSVGTYFCYGMFANCYFLESLPESFSLPLNINSIGNDFCNSMFLDCSVLTSLPNTFTLPQNIISAGAEFCGQMFRKCSSLVTLPESFNLPQNITSIGHDFCVDMFQDCSSLEKLPDNFNIPQNITGNLSYNFCYYMYNGCTNLVSLPDNFRLPQNESTALDPYCKQMFYNCSSLSSGEKVILTFKYDGTDTFVGTEFTPTSPTAGSTYYIKGNSEV